MIDDEKIREAKKFMGLIEAFDMDTLGGMEENLVRDKEQILVSLEGVDLEDKPQAELLNTSLINSDELLSDFVLIRDALREDIRSTKTMLSKLGQDISASHADDISGSLVLAYAELKKGNVASIKMLMDSYNSVGETQLKIKKLITEIKDMEDEDNPDIVNNTINFIGTPAEMLESLKKN